MWHVVLIVLASLLAVALSIFMILTGVRLFEKAGTPGWKSAIAFVNTINFYDIMSSSDQFWGMLLTGGYALFLGILIPYAAGIFKIILIAAGSIVCFCFYAHACIVGAKRFGKSVGFAIGIMLLPIVFLPILAYGKAVYAKNP